MTGNLKYCASKTWISKRRHFFNTGVVRASKPSVEYVRTMVAARAKFGSDEVCKEILDKGLSTQTLPGTAEAQCATWFNNDWLSTDMEGDIIEYRRWGAIVSSVEIFHASKSIPSHILTTSSVCVFVNLV